MRKLTRSLLPLFILLLPAASHAELELTLGGRVQTDLRFRGEEVGVGKYYQRLELPVGVARNENILKLKLNASYDNYAAVAEVDLVLVGISNELGGLADLSLRGEVDPFRFEAHAMYLEAIDLGIEGLDLRVGQQLVQWGKGDQFNPTNTLNALDLEDPLLFGEQLANMMVKLDYTIKNTWTLSAVMVPIFKPALLPNSAPLGTAAVDRLPFSDAAFRHRVHAEQAMAEKVLGYPTIVTRVTPVLPETSLSNMQLAFRVAGVVADQDLALSYYNGRTDMPQAYLNITNKQPGRQCDPQDPKACISGLFETQTFVGYPRVQVIGLNAAGQIPLEWITPKLKSIGYRVELGLFIPQQATISLYNNFDLAGFISKGEYPYDKHAQPDGRRPVVVQDTPFAKWVVGLDYTFNRHVYLNAQWVHGFPDEFGAGDFITEGWVVRQGGITSEAMDTLTCATSRDGTKCAHEILRPRLGDYLVLGIDFRFLSERALLRIFTIWDLNGVHEERWDEKAANGAGERVRQHHSMFSAEGFSAVLYPEFLYNFGNGLELGAGALLMLGRPHTKFGDPATGGSQVWTRARFSF